MILFAFAFCSFPFICFLLCFLRMNPYRFHCRSGCLFLLVLLYLCLFIFFPSSVWSMGSLFFSASFVGSMSFPSLFPVSLLVVAVSSILLSFSYPVVSLGITSDVFDTSGFFSSVFCFPVWSSSIFSVFPSSVSASLFVPSGCSPVFGVLTSVIISVSDWVSSFLLLLSSLYSGKSSSYLLKQ